MRYLEKHIIRLLLDNDCVIVPGFGGFMAHNIPAKYDEQTQSYTPPMRIVGFNSQLTMNDSLLAQEYANIYNISFPDALRQIASDVDKLKQCIKEAKVYEFYGIGTFSLDAQSGIIFTPEKTGIMTPPLYALDPISIKYIENTVKPGNIEIEEGQKPLNTDDNIDTQRSISVNIPLHYIKQLVAACIAIVIMLTLPAKLGDSSKAHIGQSSMNASWVYEIMPKDITSGKPEKLSDIVNKDETDYTQSNSTNNSDDSRATAIGATRNDITDTYYSIVLASRVSKKNAEEYVKKLHKKGMIGAMVHTSSKGNTKVIFKKFKTRRDAQNALSQITNDIEFEGSWITEIKE